MDSSSNGWAGHGICINVEVARTMYNTIAEFREPNDPSGEASFRVFQVEEP